MVVDQLMERMERLHRLAAYIVALENVKARSFSWRIWQHHHMKRIQLDILSRAIANDMSQVQLDGPMDELRHRWLTRVAELGIT